MESHGEDVNVNHPVADRIHQTMLVCDAATPQTMLLTLQGFRFADARKWMLKNIFEQLRDALHHTGIAGGFPIGQSSSA